MKATIRIVATDGSEWLMTTADVAVHRANVIAKQTNEQPVYILSKEVFPAFEKDPNSILAWAKTQMKPEDISLTQIGQPRPLKKEDILKNGTWRVQ